MPRLSDTARWSNGTVVITGASAGVGRATAVRFARAGAQLGLIARDRAALESLRDELAAIGGRAIVAPADVADANAVFAAADMIARDAGPIGVWINDAMVTVFSPLSEMTPEEFHRVTDVTYLGFVHGTMAALRHMQPRNRGIIVQVGSALAYRGIPLQSAYCGAKHAIRGFTDSLRAELLHARSRIKLVTVELPAVNTPQFDWARTHLPRQPRPIAPVVQPEVIAEAIIRAVLWPRREYWVGLSTVKAIVANLVLPQLLDRYLARVAYDGQMTKAPILSGRQDNLTVPVHALHRTRGSFGQGALGSALILPGPTVRLAAVIAGAVLAFGLGAAMQSLAAPRARIGGRSGRK
jgi:short-subunit dehydrogenase